jgi:hypothetical protein
VSTAQLFVENRKAKAFFFRSSQLVKDEAALAIASKFQGARKKEDYL